MAAVFGLFSSLFVDWPVDFSSASGDIEDPENTQPSNGGNQNTQPSGDVPGEGD